MLLRYFYNRKLAHASYLCGCTDSKEAFVVDPGIDMERYIKAAAEEGVRITAVLETHIHADYVSGAAELAKQCDAQLLLSDEGDEHGRYEVNPSFNCSFVKNGDTFTFGKIKLEAWHTPGHTPEHLSFKVKDMANRGLLVGIFTGDFVFVGDVGRPDLLEVTAGIEGNAKQSARKMFHSLKVFKELSDYLQIWPSHGAGSACGKSLGANPFTTVGYEKRTNWALQYEDEEHFIKDLIEGQTEPPAYFARMKQINKDKREASTLWKVPVEADPTKQTLEYWLRNGAVILDTRSIKDFSDGHFPGSINIPYGRSFLQWAGQLIDCQKPICFITDEENGHHVAKDLQSIGIHNLEEYMIASPIHRANLGFTEGYQEVRPFEVEKEISKNQILVIDVRSRNERNKGYIPHSMGIPLPQLSYSIGDIPRDKPILLQCQGGQRSAIAASICQANGIRNVKNLAGGIQAWITDGLTITT